MKKSIILFVLMLISMGAYSQSYKGKTTVEEAGKDQITVRVQVFANDKKSDRNDFEVDIVNLATNGHNSHKTESSFTILLQYNSKFKIVVGHKDFNYRTVEIDTHAPVERWVLDIDLYLYSGEANSSAGKLQYSEQAKNFVKVD